MLLTSVQLSPTAAAGNTRKTDRWVYTRGLQARPQNYVELNSNFLKALPAIFSSTQALLLFLFLSWRSIHWYLSLFPGSDPNWLPLGCLVSPFHSLSCHHLLKAAFNHVVYKKQKTEAPPWLQTSYKTGRKECTLLSTPPFFFLYLQI